MHITETVILLSETENWCGYMDIILNALYMVCTENIF